MRRALLRVAALAGLALALTAPAAAAAPIPGILYALDAKGPTIARNGMALRLSMPANSPVTWFTDRPARNAGVTNLWNLAAIWETSGFAEGPPNAALLLAHVGIERTHVVTLRAPRVANGRVSFTLRAVPEGTEAGHAHADDVQAGRYGRARLFIDDATTPPCPTALVTAPQVGLTCLLAPGASSAVQPAASALSVRACSPLESAILIDLGLGDASPASLTSCGTTGTARGPSAAAGAPEVAALFSNRTPSVAPVRLTNVSGSAVAMIAVVPVAR